jgi:hypothetical protein
VCGKANPYFLKIRSRHSGKQWWSCKCGAEFEGGQECIAPKNIEPPKVIKKSDVVVKEEKKMGTLSPKEYFDAFAVRYNELACQTKKYKGPDEIYTQMRKEGWVFTTDSDTPQPIIPQPPPIEPEVQEISLDDVLEKMKKEQS